ncbi:hypothetical protein BGZ94_010229, partial [Podila epigama]
MTSISPTTEFPSFGNVVGVNSKSISTCTNDRPFFPYTNTSLVRAIREWPRPKKQKDVQQAWPFSKVVSQQRSGYSPTTIFNSQQLTNHELKAGTVEFNKHGKTLSQEEYAKVESLERDDVSETAALHHLLWERDNENTGWYVATQLDKEGEPAEDILDEPNVFVVVDNDGKSRLVAWALVSGESKEDYEWTLEQLLRASDRAQPHVIMVDEDLAMEPACCTILSGTTWFVREADDEEIEKASRDDRLKISPESMLAKLDAAQVACVFD